MCGYRSASTVPSLDDVVVRFEGRARDIIRDADIAVRGTVRIVTTPYLKNPQIILTMREKEEHRAEIAADNAARDKESEDRWNADAPHRLRSLWPIRRLRRQRLRDTRRARCNVA